VSGTPGGRVETDPGLFARVVGPPSVVGPAADVGASVVGPAADVDSPAAVGVPLEAAFEDAATGVLGAAVDPLHPTSATAARPAVTTIPLH
jgi:hypothetical protein